MKKLEMTTMKIDRKYKRFYRILFLIAFVFLSRVFYSCLCPENLQYYDITYIELGKIDASQMYINQYLEADTMYSASVALKVELFGPDTLLRYSYIPSFPLAMAMEECLPSYRPVQQIESIRIITLLDYNAAFPANAELSSIFYGFMSDNSSSDFLYQSLDSLLLEVNSSTSYGEQVQRFFLVCKENAENDSAAFKIIISLSDGKELEANSGIIPVIPSHQP